MSIAELKLKVIEKLATLNNEDILKNILEQLDKKENKPDSKVHNLSQHFESISERYKQTLKKLAQ
ncbi:MAG TPA: hypothetical protein VIJ75_04205 [Hanamia sp.]